MDFKIFVIGFVVLSMFFGCVSDGTAPKGNQTDGNISLSPDVKKLDSIEEVKAFLKQRQEERPYMAYEEGISMAINQAMMPLGDAAGTAKSAESASRDYSETNIQVEGVDEADFVKTDGDYIYILSGNRLIIMLAYPAENANILSETEIKGQPREIFINRDDLVVFSDRAPVNIVEEVADKVVPGYYWESNTMIAHYDVSQRSRPKLVEETVVEGSYFNSRMIGRHVYAVVNKQIPYWMEDDDDDSIKPPEVYRNGVEKSQEFPAIYAFDYPCHFYRYTTIVSYDLDEEESKESIYLTGGTSEMYVSQSNIYVTTPSTVDFAEGPVKVVQNSDPSLPPVLDSPLVDWKEATVIHRIEIKEGEVSLEASGAVPGHILNQFSMDEYDGHFRIATSLGNVARFEEQATSKNNIYVLDMDLERVGAVEDLAPGEKIYSARFMGGRAYLVTFRKVDPLFVIDLKDPEDPKVLGKLKIPGYSDYLHPYDENHLIGLGKEAIPADEGDFSWYQGVKLSLFDVSDVEKPKEISKFEIGDRGTDSEALRDHKAFLFDREKNLLVIPILLAEIDEEKYPAGVEPYQSGEYTFQGAYVFRVSSDRGFEYRGRISHVEDDSFRKSGYYWGSDYSVRRSLYIEDVLYTISNRMVKLNDLKSLEELNEVDLPYDEPESRIYPLAG